MTGLINVIHLSEDQVSDMDANSIATEVLRRQSYMEEMAGQNTRHIVWDGIIDKPVFKGISKSHKAIIKHAKDKNIEQVCVMEDDCKFSHHNSYKYFLQNIPQEFDLYTGLVYQGEIGEDNRLLNGFSGILTFYICHQRFYDTFLKLNPEKHLDNALGEIAFNHLFFVCLPMVVTQLNGFSYNHKKNMNYDQYAEDRFFFNDL